MAAADSTGFAPLVQAGKLRVLNTWGEKRLEKFPDAPTLKELGLDIVQNSPFGIGAPRDTPPAVVKSLHDAFKKAMEDPSYVQALARYDMLPMYMSSAGVHEVRAGDLRARKGAGREAGAGQAQLSVVRVRRAEAPRRPAGRAGAAPWAAKPRMPKTAPQATGVAARLPSPPGSGRSGRLHRAGRPLRRGRHAAGPAAGAVPDGGGRRTCPCLLPLVDGVLLTGSPSNVEATHFGATPCPPTCSTRGATS